jgi:hypothetical protein
MDLDMEPGVDFVDQINEAVGSCRLLVAVIGPRWASVEDAHGRRRLDDPADFIRVEVEAGLRQPDVRVVPVLVQGAAMPTAEELPRALADLARRNALELSDARWRFDVDRLAGAAERVLDRSGEAAVEEDRPTPSRRRRRWAPIAALALAAAAGVVALLVAGGDGGEPSVSRLSDVIPAAIRERCERSEGKDFWMKNLGAVEQEICGLPKSVLSEGAPGGDITYGLFRTAAKARSFVEHDFNSALRDEDKPGKVCSEETTNRLEADYGSGNAECYTNSDGLTINWADRDSGVAAQLYFHQGTRADAAVETLARLV